MRFWKGSRGREEPFLDVTWNSSTATGCARLRFINKEDDFNFGKFGAIRC